MKLRADRKFPYNFLWGVQISKYFGHVFPKKRSEIMRVKKDAEFQTECALLFNQLPNRETMFSLPDDASYRRLAEFLEVTICIRKDCGIVRFGAGKQYL